MLYLLLSLAGAAVFIVAFAFVLHHRKSATTPFHIIGKTGLVETSLTPEGAVLLNGELWRARAHDGTGIVRGQTVRVCGTDGCRLMVEVARDDS